MKQSKQEIRQHLYPAEAGFTPAEEIPVGGVVAAESPICYNEGRPTLRLTVRNTGDRPIQVGSHFHFFEVNRLLEFDRRQAFGCHLNIPATTAIRFEPGDEQQVELVPFGGKQRIVGFNGLVQGFSGVEDQPTYYPTRERAFHRMEARGFCHATQHSEATKRKNHTKEEITNGNH